MDLRGRASSRILTGMTKTKGCLAMAPGRLLCRGVAGPAGLGYATTPGFIMAEFKRIRFASSRAFLSCFALSLLAAALASCGIFTAQDHYKVKHQYSTADPQFERTMNNL